MIPFKLIVITDWTVPDCVERAVAAARVSPLVAIQHRHPGATDARFFEEGRRLREALGPTAHLFVNHRADVAIALGAHLHLTEASLDVKDVRPLFPPGRRLISASWHEGGAPREVDLLLLSPVFAPHSKVAGGPPLGVERFEALARTTSTPVFALGGVGPENVRQLRGHAGAAVIGAVMHADDPVKATTALLAGLE